MAVTITINGKQFECQPSDVVIKIAMDNGIFVPHYCWHPGLVPEGNCRMCLVKTSTSRKLEVSCMMKVQDKMVIETETTEVKEARKSVLEFLLANHPLDCPVCDKSGECLLQDYTYNWRGAFTQLMSRFPGVDEKNIKPTKDLSDKIRIWGNRCIVCTRCTRFYRDVVGDAQLTVVDRGDHSYIDVFPGKSIDNKMSLNVVDICPVGALINKEFLYKTRVWFAQQKPTVCNLCSKGCNVSATVVKNDIKRVVPRFNANINGYWMCDIGRGIHYPLSSDQRLHSKIGSIDTIKTALKKICGNNNISSVGMVISSGNTCSEIDAFKQLIDSLGSVVTVGFITNKEEDVQYKAFTIEAEKSSNRKYLEDVFGVDVVNKGLNDVNEGLSSGTIKCLIVFNLIPFYRFSRLFIANCEHVDFIALVSVTETGLEEKSHCIIPSKSYLEKVGDFVNSKGIKQHFEEVVNAPSFYVDQNDILDALNEFAQNELSVQASSH